MQCHKTAVISLAVLLYFVLIVLLSRCVASQVIKAIEGGQIKKFVLIGGCDGSESERSYYRNLARKLPEDNVILTLGCAKFRFNKLFDKFGNVPGTGIPRMLDIGQCNDSYSAIQIAVALANVRVTAAGMSVDFVVPTVYAVMHRMIAARSLFFLSSPCR